MISHEGRGEAYVRKCLDNLWKLKRDGMEGFGELEVLETATDVDRVTGGIMAGDWGYVNWGSGWADAGKSMVFAKEMISPGRVDFRFGAEVTELLFETGIDSPGSAHKKRPTVTGVLLRTGESIHADLIVLATGAWTNKLFDLRGRIEATGQPLAYLSLSNTEEEKLMRRPVTMSMATGIYTLPQQDGTLKVGRNSYGYRNPIRAVIRDALGETYHYVSLPRVNVSLPLEAREAFRTALKGIDMSGGREFGNTRVCWYTDTQEGNFLISFHPEYDETLFLATDGSGHGFKFLPVIGERIVDTLEGKLDTTLRPDM